MQFPGGAYAAVISQTLAAFENHQTLNISGKEGALWVGWSGATDRTHHPAFFLRAHDGKEIKDIAIDRITGEVFELEDQIAMCLAAQRSIETGAPIGLRQVLSSE